MEASEIQETAALLLRNWGVETHTPSSWQDLRMALQLQMEAMLSNDFERLVQTMYRLDVAELKFQAALKLRTIPLQAEALANIVLDRELQRLATWKKYSNRYD